MTPEQVALLEKAVKSLDVARLLASEEHHDFSISRAYYTMFYAAEALLLGEGLHFSKHSAVIAAFGQHFARTGRLPAHLHRYLLKGQDMRLISDYDPSTKLTAEHSQVVIERAEEFLYETNRYLAPKQDDSLQE